MATAATRSPPATCATVEPFYIQAAAWSPDDSTIFIGTTGYHPNGCPVGRPANGLCDAAAAFPATQAPVRTLGQLHRLRLPVLRGRRRQHRLLRRARALVDEPRRLRLRRAPEPVAAPGFEGLSATTGVLTFNPTRGRGLGADDMLPPPPGCGSPATTMNGASQCGGKSGSRRHLLPALLNR